MVLNEMSNVKGTFNFERSFSAGCVSQAFGRRDFRADLGQHISLTLSAAGNSAVAIDNKIEQAMDLVKSHLMFAVREEVEVLKEKIAELMDRINQLETENSILKAHASQETLAQLTPAPLQGMQPAVVSASAAIAAVAAVAVSSTTGSQTHNVSPGSAPGSGL